MVTLIRDQKNVGRLSKRHLLRPYNDMEHAYMVTYLFMRICESENIKIHVRDVDAVMKHDVVETVTTDLNWEVKKINHATQTAWDFIEKSAVDKFAPVLKPFLDVKTILGEEKHAIMKIADYLDLWMFCREEQALGNTSERMKVVISNCVDLIPMHIVPHRYKSVTAIVQEFLTGLKKY